MAQRTASYPSTFTPSIISSLVLVPTKRNLWNKKERVTKGALRSGKSSMTGKPSTQTKKTSGSSMDYLMLIKIRTLCATHLMEVFWPLAQMTNASLFGRNGRTAFPSTDQTASCAGPPKADSWAILRTFSISSGLLTRVSLCPQVWTSEFSFGMSRKNTM